MGANEAGLVGQSVRRKEDVRFLTGAGQFTDDVTFPNQAYAYFLRSPLAHAKNRGAPAAMMNAVHDALLAVGVKRIDMPASPYRVWQAIEATRQSTRG